MKDDQEENISKTKKLIFYILLTGVVLFSIYGYQTFNNRPTQKTVFPQTPIALTPTPTEEVFEDDNVATDTGIIVLTPTATPSSTSAIKK